MREAKFCLTLPLPNFPCVSTARRTLRRERSIWRYSYVFRSIRCSGHQAPPPLSTRTLKRTRYVRGNSLVVTSWMRLYLAFLAACRSSIWELAVNAESGILFSDIPNGDWQPSVNKQINNILEVVACKQIQRGFCGGNSKSCNHIWRLKLILAQGW